QSDPGCSSPRSLRPVERLEPHPGLLEEWPPLTRGPAGVCVTTTNPSGKALLRLLEGDRSKSGKFVQVAVECGFRLREVAKEACKTRGLKNAADDRSPGHAPMTLMRSRSTLLAPVVDHPGQLAEEGGSVLAGVLHGIPAVEVSLPGVALEE